MEFAEIVSYTATAFMLLGFSCRGLKLRALTFLGCVFNMIYAWMILDQSPSARSIIISNAIYSVINIVQVWRSIRRSLR